MLKLPKLKAALQRHLSPARAEASKPKATIGHSGVSSFSGTKPSVATALPWAPQAQLVNSQAFEAAALRPRLEQLSSNDAANLVQTSGSNSQPLALAPEGQLLGDSSVDVAPLSSASGTSSSLGLDDQAAVDAAAARVEEAYATGGPEVAAMVLLEEAENLGAPELVDALLFEVAPTVDAINEELAHRAAEDVDGPMTDVVTYAYSHVYGLAGEEGQLMLVDSLSAALAPHGDIDLNQLDDGLRNHVQSAGPGFAGALARSLEARGLTGVSDQLYDVALDGVEAATEAHEQASAEKAVLDQRLAEDLAIFGPGMTDAEREAYIKAFWDDPEHAAVLAKEAETASRLAEVMASEGPTLEARARAGDARAAQLLVEGWESLASSPDHAEAAIVWSGELVGDKELFDAVNAAFGGALEARLRDGLLTDAIPIVQAAAINAHPDDPTEAVEFMERLLGPLSTAETISSLSDEVMTFIGALRIVSRLDSASGEDIAKAQSLLGTLGDSGPFGKILTGSVAVLGLVSAALHFKDGKYPQGVSDVLGSLEGGYEVFGSILNVSSKLDGTLLGKILPGIGLVLDAEQIIDDVGLLRENGATTGELIAIVGTGLSIIGNVARFFPLTAPFGAVLTLVGGLVHEFGMLISGQGAQAQNARREERDTFLEKAGIPEERRESLLSDPYSSVQAGALGLEGPQFDAYRALMEEAYAANDAQDFHAASDIAALLGLEGDDALAFIEQVMALDPEARSDLWNVIDHMPLTPEASEDVIAQEQQRVIGFVSSLFPNGVLDANGEPLDLAAIGPDDANLAYFQAWPAME